MGTVPGESGRHQIFRVKLLSLSQLSSSLMSRPDCNSGSIASAYYYRSMSQRSELACIGTLLALRYPRPSSFFRM